MPYCPNCGKQIAGGQKFCPECGAPQVAASPQQAAPSPAAQAPVVPSGPARPALLTVAMICDILGGAVLLFLGIAVAIFAGRAVAADIIAAAGVLLIVVAYGYSRGEHWIRWPGVVVAVFLILLGVLVLSGRSGGAYSLGGVIVLLGAFNLYELTRTNVQSYLAKADKALPPPPG